MHKRMLVVYCSLLLLLGAVIMRVFYLSQGQTLLQAANNQSNFVLNVAQTRAMIYDCNFEPMVNESERYLAAVLPGPESTNALLQQVEGEERMALLERMQGNSPFVMEVSQPEIYSSGIDLFSIPVRYSEEQSAVHVIGYLSGDQTSGITGIEKSYNDFLNEHGRDIQARYIVDALGRSLNDHSVQITDEHELDRAGVVLTIDKEIQQLAQQAAQEHFDIGAVVVTDVETGKIKAMVSLPTYDPMNVAQSLDDPNSPLINRALSSYCVGSTYKLLTAAAAIENNIDLSEPYECKGYIDVEGQIMYCNNRAGHGQVDLETAIEVSCNPYFIQLGMRLGYEPIADLSGALGFGRPSVLAPDFISKSGYFPNRDEMNNIGDLANLSFGQGKLTATPLQIATLISAIANDGYYVTPKLVEGLTLDGTTLSEAEPDYARVGVMSAYTARRLQQYMIGVIEEGTGKNAKPTWGYAGGKTGSAQTGQYIEGENGKEEIIHAWFSGFYPAENPKYSIVVLAEGKNAGGIYAAPVFQKIVDGIAEIERSRGNNIFQ